ncbi:methylenetetrahydrofolate--tRNA-(uracil(54)-C(5))-methyltransferase (FADH(2)-oxidizing) TrmFO [Spiroplasma endosymbiont of Aspidapion aeneum]|uniref:methylenetetrahydrofolate--tRNA-(uracil(54)- C(5))-methyltransferase (FADH(2)-oxidizing) TrmFO n=1 Tax=Spiroplasma endosymbiont of Aspidapion aeneum TaxID=3066276 RepID=UPI00313E0E64
MTNKNVNIIGGGLAGCEIAWFLANNGVMVNLFESKKIKKNEIQKSDLLAELVCSNSLRSLSKLNAAGILKEEMKLLNSLIIKAAEQAKIVSDDALSVDRFMFSSFIENTIINHPNISYNNEEITKLNNDEINIIATGPLTSEKLKSWIKQNITQDDMFFYDASSPIVEKDSIDFSKTYWQNRHKNDGKYLCVGLDEKQFEDFYKELINAKKTKLNEIDKNNFFKGCQPIEELATKSKKLLINGPLSPNNLNNNDINYTAVVQLRQDDSLGNLFSFVGFQTNLKWGEQDRVLKTLPGMKNIKIVRYGVLHKNYYLNSPKVINFNQQSKVNNNLFFSGQITGVEGYIESASSGIWTGICVLAYLRNITLRPLSRRSMIGALNYYITNPRHENLKPMKANLGILDQKNKNTKSEFYSFDQSQQEIKTLINYLRHCMIEST